MEVNKIKYNNVGYRVIILTGNLRYSCLRIEIDNEDEDNYEEFEKYEYIDIDEYD